MNISSGMDQCLFLKPILCSIPIQSIDITYIIQLYNRNL